MHRSLASRAASVVVFEDDLARDDVSEALQARRDGRRRPGDARRTEDLERPRRPRRQGLRRVHDRRNRPKRPTSCRVSSGALVNAGHGDGFEGAARESIFDARSPTACAPAATWWSSARRTPTRAPPRARAAVRRQRIDGALLPHASALRPRRDEAPPPCRGVPLLHAADANHEAAPRIPGRRRTRRRVAVGAGLVRRDANWRSRQGVPPTLGPPRPERRSGGPAHLRWMGSRRSGASCATRSRGSSEAAIDWCG